MFGLMTEREHGEIVLNLESELVHETKLNDTLQERIRLSEDYRARLETEIASLKGKNRELVQKLDSAKAEVEEKLAEIERLNMKIREQQLMLGSFEARWEIRKPTPGTEEVQIPRRPPLARDDRRREVCA